MESLPIKLLSNSDSYTKHQYDVLLDISKRLASDNNEKIIVELESTLETYKILPNLLIEKDALPKLLPNFNINSHYKHLEMMGIEEAKKEGEKKLYSLNIYKFLRVAMVNASPNANFDEKVEFAFNLFDVESRGFFGLEEIIKTNALFNEANNLSFDSKTIKSISEAIFENLDQEKDGKITKESLKGFLQKFKNKNLKLNAFGKDRAKSFRMYLTY